MIERYQWYAVMVYYRFSFRFVFDLFEMFPRFWRFLWVFDASGPVWIRLDASETVTVEGMLKHKGHDVI